MTRTEIEALSPEARMFYFEQEYPYVLPDHDVIEVVNQQMLATFSPLEVAYIRWMMETGNAELSINKMIHPAYWFDKDTYGAKKLKSREHVVQFLREIRRTCPYLKIFTSDYLAGLLYDEIQYLRSRERKDRFYGPNSDPNRLIGKKSVHDQEMEEIDRLLACLKQIQELKLAAGGFSDGTVSGQRDIDSGIDRVIAESARIINAKENGDVGTP